MNKILLTTEVLKKGNKKISALYRHLKNKVHLYNLLDSLFFVWCYSRNYTFNLPFPNGFELPPDFPIDGNLFERRYKGVQEFELEFLTREFILHCHTRKTSRSLLHNNEVSILVNHLRFKFGEGISKEVDDSRDILLEFNRFAHRQFKWQNNYNSAVVLRNYKIYSDPKLSKLIHKEFGMSIYQILLIGFFVFQLSGNQFRIKLPIDWQNQLISSEMFESFLNHFSMSIEKAKQEMQETYRRDETILYSYNPLTSKPILTYKNSFICPLHLLLFHQITSGIYYFLVNKRGFQNAFGRSFEKYIGEVLKDVLRKSRIKIYPEQLYGKEHKRSSDWLLIDSESIVFIECKTKRLTFSSKSELNVKDGLENDLKKMASFITQIYKTYIDYSQGKYVNIAFDKTKVLYPLVVTLEPWYISMNIRIIPMLDNLIKAEFEHNQLPVYLLDEHPYQILSCRDFESDIQLMNQLGFKKYFSLNNEEKINLKKEFKFKEIFKGQFKKLFVDDLKKYR